MSAAKKGLGRGLSALFGDIENKSTSVEVQINKVLRSSPPNMHA